MMSLSFIHADYTPCVGNVKMIKHSENLMCSKAAQGFANVRGMKRTSATHPSATRLLEAATTLHPRRFTGVGQWADLARLLNEADQTVNNWRSRGVPKTRVHGLCDLIGCNWQWVLYGKGKMCDECAAQSVDAPISQPIKLAGQDQTTYCADALGVAMRLIREIEERGQGRLPHGEFVRLTLAVADWVASLDRAMTEEDEQRFSAMLVKLVTGMLRPLNNL